MVTQTIPLGQIGVLDKIGQGGQAVVYRALSVRTTFAKSMVYKEYKPGVLASLNVDALKAMPEFLESLPYRDGAKLISLASWPCAVVEDVGKTTGFVMPSIPDEFFTNFWTSNKSTPSTVMAEFQHLLNDPQVLAMRFAGMVITDRQRYELLRQAASALLFLHDRGVCCGDISPKNLLFSLTPFPAVYFIDCDSMRVNGVSLSHQVETPGWQVPAGEEKATVYSDRYKLGLLALRLCLGSQDAKDPGRLPPSTPAELRQVITDTLTNNPRQRPDLATWDQALAKAIAAAPKQTATAPRPVPPLVTVGPPTQPVPTLPRTSPVQISQPTPSPSTQAPTSSDAKVWAGAAVAVAVIAAVVALVAIIAQSHSNPSSPQTSQTEPSVLTPTIANAPGAAPTSTQAVDPETAALQQLQQLASQDEPYVVAQLADWWVPQLSTKQPGTFDDGVTYDNVRILQEHLGYRGQYGAKLLRSSDWSNYEKPNYWVTVVPLPSSDPGSALQWCVNHNLDDDHCFAERVSKTHPASGSTVHQH